MFLITASTGLVWLSSTFLNFPKESSRRPALQKKEDTGVFLVRREAVTREAWKFPVAQYYSAGSRAGCCFVLLSSCELYQGFRDCCTRSCTCRYRHSQSTCPAAWHSPEHTDWASCQESGFDTAELTSSAKQPATLQKVSKTRYWGLPDLWQTQVSMFVSASQLAQYPPDFPGEFLQTMGTGVNF